MRRPSSDTGERVHLVRPDLHLHDHVQDLVEFVVNEALSDVVLVGHSYGGMVITGAAEPLADRIRHLVYVDALAPRDGDSALSVSRSWRRHEILEAARRWGGAWVPFRGQQWRVAAAWYPAADADGPGPSCQ